jgi:serine/threonine protein kinase
MEFVHSKGIAHRDLKLENCFLSKDVLLKVADFGLAKAFDGP